MTDKNPKYFWKGTPKNSSETFTNTKIRGYTADRIILDDIATEERDPLMEERIRKLVKQAAQTRENLIRKALASGHCLDDIAGFKEGVTTKGGVTEYSSKLVLREEMYKDPDPED